MQHVAELASDIQKNGISEAAKSKLKGYFSHDKQLIAMLDNDETSVDELIHALIDRHGTGRALFRNRRARLKGFPKRTLVDHRLSPTKSYLEKLAEFDPEEIEPIELMDIATARYSTNLRNVCSKRKPSL